MLSSLDRSSLQEAGRSCYDVPTSYPPPLLFLFTGSLCVCVCACLSVIRLSLPFHPASA